MSFIGFFMLKVMLDHHAYLFISGLGRSGGSGSVRRGSANGRVPGLTKENGVGLFVRGHA